MNQKENQILKPNITDFNKNCLNKEKDQINVTETDDMNIEFRDEKYLKINTQNKFDIYDLEESDRKLNKIINYIEDLIKVNLNNKMLKNFLITYFQNVKVEFF